MTQGGLYKVTSLGSPFVLTRIGDTMFDIDDFDAPFDGDDFDLQNLVERMTYVTPAQAQQYWTTKGGKQIKYQDMEKSHILNSMNMIRHNDEAYAENPKYLRLQEELKKRLDNVITVKREFTITKAMLIKLLQDQGIKVDDCGFYINCSYAQGISIEEIKARWDCDEPIKPKVDHGNKKRNRGNTKSRVPRRRSTKGS